MKRVVTVGCFIVMLIWGMSYVPVILSEYSAAHHENQMQTTVILDAGHGGKDGGAQAENGAYEKDVVLAITRKVESYLRGQGINVLLTRTDDHDLASEGAKKRKMEDLLARVNLFNTTEEAIMVSIHANATTNATWKGAQTFYDPKKEENKELGTLVMESIKSNIAGMTRSATATSEIFVLKNCKITATLVEVGFLSHPDEAALLTTDAYQEQVAYAIYEGIITYLDQVKE